MSLNNKSIKHIQDWPSQPSGGVQESEGHKDLVGVWINDGFWVGREV